MAAPIKLKLPATSANLGPGFDALGLAMDFALHIDAHESETFSIKATGRNAAQCGDVADSLVLETYQSVLTGQGIDPTPIHLDLHNEIPLGMGCGSSAAALVAGVSLASHFGGLHWTREQILTEASLREGHPDNVAACVLGGLTVSSMLMPEEGPAIIDALSIAAPVSWPLLVVMPDASLSTKKARALLPETYSKADAIANVQRVAMLTAAFAQGRGDLLVRAMDDRMHQPYRAAACPLLPRLLPLAGHDGILGVALSGAGPSVLMILQDQSIVEHANKAVQGLLMSGDPMQAEILLSTVGNAAIVF
ncbi:homoserine kinase [Terriglobus roseus]|uniref:Homoserine kinase n=1 Tax=Terriglobus roseus TaxID=392734 RepID=A0A1H4S8M7_9BACT|nr:homoserine kinase [Terriglobus roseus]SEC40427.1 homoserine kinase [Terriglobus roseus]